MNEGAGPKARRIRHKARTRRSAFVLGLAAALALFSAMPRARAQATPSFNGFKSGISYANIVPPVVSGLPTPVAANQVSVVTGHFRSASKPLDLAVADAANQTIEIWFGNGDGTFQRPASAEIYTLPPLTSIYPTAPPPVVEPTMISTTGNTQIAAADLSGTASGVSDIVLVNVQGPGTITLLKNNRDGSGTFTVSLIPAEVNNQNYVTNRGGSFSIAIGDFNGDGFLDLAVGNSSGNYATPANATSTITVVFNNCGGGGADDFCSPVSYSAGLQTVGIAAAPLQGSNTNFEDIVATDGENVYVLLNKKVNGTTGNFPSTPNQSFAINANSYQAISGVITADVNGDGYQDVILEDQFGDPAVLLNAGGGSAGTLHSPTTALPDNFAAAAGAFNNASSTYPGLVLLASGGIEFFPNNSGTLGTPAIIGPFSDQFEIGAALAVGQFDINNNTNDDVVAVNGSEIHVVLGNGDGTFQTAPSYLESAADPAEIAASPAGNFTTSIAAVAVGNLHGSGSMDVVTADIGAGDTAHPNPVTALIVRLANPDGTLPSSGTTVIYQQPITDVHFNSIVLGNFGGAGLQSGGNGAMDIAAVTATGEIYVFQNNGSGSFTLTANSPIASGFSPLTGAVAGDFKGHGGAPTDIAAIGPVVNADNFFNVPQSGSVVVILGNGNGTFVQNGGGGYGTAYQGTPNAAGLALTTYVNPAQLAVGSLGSSSYPDIVVADSGETYPTSAGGGVWVLENSQLGDGSFHAAPQQISSTSAGCCASRTAGPSSIALGKIFGSSFLDIAAASSAGSGQFLEVLQNSGSYTFPATPAATFPYGGQVAIADVNHDGAPDVVVLSDIVQVLLNTTGYAGASGILLPWDPSYSAGPVPSLPSSGPQPPLLSVGYLSGSTVPNVLTGDSQPAVDVLLNSGSGGSGTGPSMATYSNRRAY